MHIAQYRSLILIILTNTTVDDISPALPLRTLNYGNYGIFLVMGNADCGIHSINRTTLHDASIISPQKPIPGDKGPVERWAP